MNQPKTLQETSDLFKDVFLCPKGLIALEKIKAFGLGNAAQNIACAESTNQTFYNLGANAVYRYIQFLIDWKPEPTKDCEIQVQED